VICEAAFDGRSCVLATASASLMTELLVGKTPAQAKMLFQHFHALAGGDTEKFKDGMEAETARMTVLSGIHAYPVRVRCATLAWKTMLAALEKERSQQ
jgi:nitrogen fixation NifU-like protein